MLYLQAIIHSGTLTIASTKRLKMDDFRICPQTAHLKRRIIRLLITIVFQDNRTGFGRLSDYAISFHYVPPKTM